MAIKVVTYNSAYDKIIKVKHSNGYTRSVYLTKYPTQNCQVSAIGIASNLITVKEEDESELISQLRKHTLSQIWVDLTEKNHKPFRKRYKKYFRVVFTKRYEISNGSKMVMSLLAWK